MGAHFERARLFYRQGRYAHAERELREELAQSPHWGQAHAFLGRCLARQSRLTEALEAGEEGVRLAPELAYAHFMFGLTFLDLNQLEKAEAALREALRLEPRNPEQLEWLSWVQFQRGEKRRALATVNEGLEIDPEQVGCLNRRGYYLRWLGDWRESEMALRAALKLDPENAYTHTNLGWTLWSKAHAQAGVGPALKLWVIAWRPMGEPLRHFREGLRLDPGSDWARAGAADVFLKRGKAVFLLILFALLFAAVFFLNDRPAGAGPADPLQEQRTLGRLLLPFGLFTLIFSNGPSYALARRSRFAAAVLTPAHRRAAHMTMACLAAAGGAFFASLLTPPPIAFTAMFLCLTLVGPLAAAGEAIPGWPQKFMIAYAILFAAVGMAGVAGVAWKTGGPSAEGGLPLLWLLTPASCVSRGLAAKVTKLFNQKSA